MLSIPHSQLMYSQIVSKEMNARKNLPNTQKKWKCQSRSNSLSMAENSSQKIIDTLKSRCRTKCISEWTPKSDISFNEAVKVCMKPDSERFSHMQILVQSATVQYRCKTKWPSRRASEALQPQVVDKDRSFSAGRAYNCGSITFHKVTIRWACGVLIWLAAFWRSRSV